MLQNDRILINFTYVTHWPMV